MRRVLTEQIVAGRLFCFPQLGLIYLRNPKVGCTTIQYNLVKAANARDGIEKRILPHRRDQGQYVNDIFNHPLFGSQELREMTCFSVVRNPFIRILSAYLNKFVDKKPTWRRFATAHGLDPDARENEMSFIDFLRIIDAECDETLNEHFKPQYLNLMMPFSRPRFVGRLEEFGEVEKFLADRGISDLQRKGATTNTSGRVGEFYTAQAEAIVARKFADDFRLFGYSPQLSEVKNPLEPQWQADGPDLLMQWLADGKFPADQLDPVPRAYVQFCAEKDPEKQMEIVRDIFMQDDNTKRLKSYALNARQSGNEALAKAVDERVEMLRNAWRERMEHGRIFVPATKSRSDRRAARRERLDSRRQART